MKGVLAGLLTHLRDFEFASAASGQGAPLAVAAGGGPIIGPPGCREQVAAALAAAGPAIGG